MAGDELGDDFGVGVAVEDDAFAFELALERGVVLDDAVMDDGDEAVAADDGDGRCDRWRGRAWPSACD